MGVNIDVSELNALAGSFENTAGAVGGKTALALKKVAHNIEAEAKVFAPVDTGALMGSISTTITGDGRFGAVAAEIGPTVEYGHWVEFGTTLMAPHAYMGPAFDRHAWQFEKALSIIAADVL